MESELYWSFLYFYHMDKMNSCIHRSPVRFSPITFSTAQVLLDEFAKKDQPTDLSLELNEVRAHKDQYELDKGR